MPLKIIYIDDEPALCEIFSEEFATRDMAITTYADPQKAIEASQLARPDICFIDYRLPGVTGDLVAQKMPSGFPIYLITGESNPVLNFKFSGIFGKPLKWDEIRAILTELRDKKQN